jgi:hypothetical protein
MEIGSGPVVGQSWATHWATSLGYLNTINTIWATYGPLIGRLRRPYICTNVFPRSSVPVPILLPRTPLTSCRRMLHFRSARRSCSVAIVVAPLTSRYVTWCPCWCGVPCRCSCVVCACGRSCRRRRCRCRGGKEETKRIRRGCSITLR